MKRACITVLSALLLAIPTLGQAQEGAPVTLTVDSPSFTFSPGNWSGDQGRGGGGYRQTWNPGAYFRVTWEGKATIPPTLLLDTSTHDPKTGAPTLAYCLDGVWSGNVPSAKEISLEGAKPEGKHTLTVYLKSSPQMNRWGSPGTSGLNVLRVSGLKVSSGSKPAPETPAKKWALIIGDSITEGVGAYELECYSHLVGEGLRTQGFEYGVSACGWSGWINKGDNPPGDVPGYYAITESVNGAGGKYDDAASRWNKIDANHSLLDANGRISAYGANGQEPTLITINYGTNDAIWKQNPSDVKASMAQALPALRKAAPGTHIVFIIPFGQYKAAEINETVAAYHKAHPDDRKISIIDLGQDTARAIAKKGYWGDLHPNPRAHATFGVQITAQLLALMGGENPPRNGGFSR